MRTGESYSGNAIATVESTGGALVGGTGTSDDCGEGSDGEKTGEAGEHFADRGDDVRLRGDWMLVGWW